MNIGDFIGFFIVLIAFFLSSVLQRRDKKRRKEHPEEYEGEEGEQAEVLKELLRSLDIGVEEQTPPSPPKKPKTKPKPPPRPTVVKAAKTKRRVGDQFAFETNIENRYQESSIKERHLDLAIDEHTGESHFSDRYEDVPHADIWKRGKRKGASRANRLLNEVSSLQDVIVLGEIIGPPKADQ